MLQVYRSLFQNDIFGLASFILLFSFIHFYFVAPYGVNISSDLREIPTSIEYFFWARHMVSNKSLKNLSV